MAESVEESPSLHSETLKTPSTLRVEPPIPVDPDADLLEAKVDPRVYWAIVESYEGELVDQLPEGKGKVQFHSGCTYDGYFRYGCMHGEGVFTWPDGVQYAGQFVCNKIQGQGKYTWPNGVEYEGDVEDGRRHGVGTLRIAETAYAYEGGWENGMREGMGIIFYNHSQSCYYEGELKNNVKCGTGKMVYQSGDVYEGGWQDDQKCGHGTMEWENNGARETYEGQWARGMRNGHGVYTWCNSTSKTSPWARLNQYDGEWLDSKRHGHGIMGFASGARYVGQFSNDAKEGFGVLTNEDGSTSSGTFKENKLLEHVSATDSSCGESGANVIPADLLLSVSVKDEPIMRNRLQAVLLRYISDLRAAYRHFATPLRDGSAFALRLSSFWEIARECRLCTPHLTLAELDCFFVHADATRASGREPLIGNRKLSHCGACCCELCMPEENKRDTDGVLGCGSGSLNAHDPDRPLNFFEFASGLLRLAVAKYEDICHEDPSKCIQEAFSRDIIPYFRDCNFTPLPTPAPMNRSGRTTPFGATGRKARRRAESRTGANSVADSASDLGDDSPSSRRLSNAGSTSTYAHDAERPEGHPLLTVPERTSMSVRSSGVSTPNPASIQIPVPSGPLAGSSPPNPTEKQDVKEREPEREKPKDKDEPVSARASALPSRKNSVASAKGDVSYISPRTASDLAATITNTTPLMESVDPNVDEDLLHNRGGVLACSTGPPATILGGMESNPAYEVARGKGGIDGFWSRRKGALVGVVLQAEMSMLQLAFNWNARKRNKQTLSIRDVLGFLTNSKVVSEPLTVSLTLSHIASTVFSGVWGHDEDILDTLDAELIFVEFVDVLVRIAEVKASAIRLAMKPPEPEPEPAEPPEEAPDAGPKRKPDKSIPASAEPSRPSSKQQGRKKTPPAAVKKDVKKGGGGDKKGKGKGKDAEDVKPADDVSSDVEEKKDAVEEKPIAAPPTKLEEIMVWFCNHFIGPKVSEETGVPLPEIEMTEDGRVVPVLHTEMPRPVSGDAKSDGEPALLTSNEAVDGEGTEGKDSAREDA
eukprot:Rmarinus@m.5872